ncbi:hypothetical protein ACFZAM_31380 [Streptomyces sp. NPDC008079]|uniref:hypothetical protein n=1 Tax=Streptomyces sp. NPDC008079 TaxID=3364806 RepID=UPI0036E6D571
MTDPLVAVPGQRSVGTVDAFLRDNPGDGTLGVPDHSPFPYSYVAMLAPDRGDLRWSVDQFRAGESAGFKGAADGLGTLRNISAPGLNYQNAFLVQVLPQTTGTRQAPSGASTPDTQWGPRDFALAIRHPGNIAWDTSTRSYVAFMQATNSVGMRLTTTQSAGTWDAEVADSAAITLTNASLPQIWDGNVHTISAATFGQNVLTTIDGRYAVPFRAPRAYHRNPNGTINTAVFDNLPSIGAYGGFDTRGTETYLYQWQALDAASGDCFYYDRGPLTVQTPNATTYTPTTLSSGETWVRTGTATGSKDGVLLAASSTLTWTVRAPHGLICTKWGTVATEGGVLLRRQDAANYYLITSTGAWIYTGGVGTKFATWTTPLAAEDNVVIRNLPSQLVVYVNGIQIGNFTVGSFSNATGLGLLSPASGSSAFRYIAFQPLPNPVILPTS